jgi:hypothetical protein
MEEDEEEDLSSYWKNLREREDTRIKKGNTNSDSVANWLWKKLRVSFKTLRN